MNVCLFLLTRFLGKVRDALLRRYWQSAVPWWMRRAGVVFEGRTTFYGWPIVSIHPGSQLRIADGVVLCSSSRFTALGVSRPVVLRTMRRNARIVVGSHTGLSGTVICAAIGIEIGSECLIGADVMIFDNDFHPVAAEGRRYNNNPSDIAASAVSIGNNVFIGAGSKVLKGVMIGDHAVVGAGSVVTRDVPPGAIAVGNPAKIVGSVMVDRLEA